VSISTQVSRTEGECAAGEFHCRRAGPIRGRPKDSPIIQGGVQRDRTIRNNALTTYIDGSRIGKIYNTGIGTASKLKSTDHIHSSNDTINSVSASGRIHDHQIWIRSYEKSARLNKPRRAGYGRIFEGKSARISHGSSHQIHDSVGIISD
jgi:hypothetical protein